MSTCSNSNPSDFLAKINSYLNQIFDYVQLITQGLDLIAKKETIIIRKGTAQELLFIKLQSLLSICGLNCLVIQQTNYGSCPFNFKMDYSFSDTSLPVCTYIIKEQLNAIKERKLNIAADLSHNIVKTLETTLPHCESCGVNLKYVYACLLVDLKKYYHAYTTNTDVHRRKIFANYRLLQFERSLRKETNEISKLSRSIK